jgi:hypothetical protein
MWTGLVQRFDQLLVLFGETIHLCGAKRRSELLVLVVKLVDMLHLLCALWIRDGLVAFA